jgi:hypothetical protein
MNESPRRREARYLKSNLILYAVSGEELILPYRKGRLKTAFGG